MAPARRRARQPVAGAQPARHVGAVGLLGHVVAGALEGARPAAAADPLVLAGAALALERLEVAQVGEQRRRAPDVAEGLLANVAGRLVEVAAGLHLADVRDEAEADAGQAAAAQRVQAAVRVRVHLERGAVGPGALAHDPPVVRHVGRLEEQRRRALRVVDPVEGALVVVGVELLVGELLAAAGRHQHEGVEAHRAELLGQRQQARQVAPRSGA